MPFTHLVFLIGSLALVGIPPLAGFWSKDAVLSSALATGGGLGWTLYVGGLVGALLTGAYTFRLYLRVFHGAPGEAVPVHDHAHDHVHGDHHHHHGEGPRTMLLPVGILALLSVVGGLINVAGAWHPFVHWIGETAEQLVDPSVGQEYVTSAIAVGLGLVGALVAHRAFSSGREIVPAGAAWNVLHHKFYVDEAYAVLFERPAQAASNAIRELFEEPVVHRSLDEVGTRRRRDCLARLAPADRAAPELRPRDRRDRRRPPRDRPRGALMTTALIFLPIAAALVVWLLPMPPVLDRVLGLDRGTLALIAMVGALGLFIGTVAWGFEFDQDGLQLGQRWDWFEELGVSYHVGLFGFSLWLIGLTLVVGTAAIAYGVWTGRERPRAYYPLMLLLVGALVGVFASQDLLLFYAFFEAMLIPIYLLVGVWGGPNRVKATITFVIYTMAGSLLMLASVIAFGVTQGTFDLLDSGTSDNTLVMLGFLGAFAVKAPLLPFHGWLRQAYTESTPEVAAMLSGVVSKAAVYGMIWIVLRHFPGPVADLRGFILVVAALTLLYGSIVAFRQPDARGVIAYSSMGQMGLITLGDLRRERPRPRRRDPPLDQPRTRLGRPLPARRDDRDAHRERRFASLGGMASGRPVLATLVMVVGMFTLAVPGSSNFAGEFSILAGVFRQRLGLRRGRRLRDRPRRDVRAAPDLRRPPRTPRLGRAGGSDATSSWSEVGLVAPLVAILVALSVWPAVGQRQLLPARRG